MTNFHSSDPKSSPIRRWPVFCVIFAAICILVRLTLVEYQANKSHTFVAAGVDELSHFQSSTDFPFARLMGSGSPHSWLWRHEHLDNYGEIMINVPDRGVVYTWVDGKRVEQILNEVAYSAAHEMNDNSNASPNLRPAMSRLFDAVYHQRRLHQLMLWGDGLELAAVLSIFIGISIIGLASVWRTA